MTNRRDEDDEARSDTGRKMTPEEMTHASALKEIQTFVRDTSAHDDFDSEKVKLLALLKAMREEISQPFAKGTKINEFAAIFVDRYNFFLDRLQELFPGRDFSETFIRLTAGDTSLEKIRLEISLLISYIQNDILDIIEESVRLKEKNKWLQNRLREMELKVAGIQAIR